MGKELIKFINKFKQKNEEVLILDFGCGVGRNIKYLFEKLEPGDINKIRIYGYDFKNLINLAKEYLGMGIWNKTNWIDYPMKNLIGLNKKNIKFDIIFASLVFQHIPEWELRNILKNLNELIKKDSILIVDSRGYLDDNCKNIWKIMNDYFNAKTEYNIEDNSENHQRVIYQKVN